MRISDWSSDVCSSDLAADRRQLDRFDHLQQRQHLPVDLRRAGPPLRGVGEAEVLVASRFGKIGGRTAMSAPFSMWVPRPVWRSLWDCRHPPRVNATPSTAFRSVSICRHPGLDPGSPAGLKSWTEEQARGDDKWDVRYRSLHEPLRGLALARSEEHTSELQSLMRNSYAVFCL